MLVQLMVSAVSVISKNGFHVKGIEISENSRKFAKKFRSIDLYPKPLAQFFKENKKKWEYNFIFWCFGTLTRTYGSNKNQ